MRLGDYIGFIMHKKYGELIENLIYQEKIIAHAILEIQYQMAVLCEIQDLLIEKDLKLANHFGSKQQVLKVLNKMMENTLIMLKQDTLEAFLHRYDYP
jgi:hypothetical protein